ncbi:hypothetical protein FB45DRAFT_298967 [Roridomyces roridus]|uniref:Uncharacterized protein n=1 Tax=Roridomyces roridus TaxID=1738132 RepID=A0AAD7CC17_9AGAR|nr:hypothetical protein FB45DRAFT_298967 [Roridomyces roridus]
MPPFIILTIATPTMSANHTLPTPTSNPSSVSIDSTTGLTRPKKDYAAAFGALQSAYGMQSPGGGQGVPPISGKPEPKVKRPEGTETQEGPSTRKKIVAAVKKVFGRGGASE